MADKKHSSNLSNSSIDITLNDKQTNFICQLENLIDEGTNTQGMFAWYLSNYLLTDFEKIFLDNRENCSSSQKRKMSIFTNLFSEFSEKYLG